MDCIAIGKILLDDFRTYGEYSWMEEPQVSTDPDLYNPLYRCLAILIYDDIFREKYLDGKIISIEVAENILKNMHPFINNNFKGNETQFKQLYHFFKEFVEES